MSTDPNTQLIIDMINLVFKAIGVVNALWVSQLPTILTQVFQAILGLFTGTG